MKPLPWSYSALSAFKQCPRNYAELKVYKHYKDEGNEKAKWGTHVHEEFEKALSRNDYKLPDNLSQYEPYLKSLRALPGVRFCEIKGGLNRQLEACDFFAKDVWVRTIIDYLVIDWSHDWAVVVDHKGLCLDTDIPTPHGFVKMRDLQVGDTVYGGSGLPCKVTCKSAVHYNPCFRIRFDDTTEIICDHEHRWKLDTGCIVCTDQLRKGDTIRIAPPAENETQELPIDPYVLGLWLADGKHSSSEISKPDKFIFDEIERRGYKLGNDTSGGRNCKTRTVKGIRRYLVGLGLLRNKHIPRVYMHASVAQRLDLLRGLMDGDGYANPTRRQGVFVNVNRQLAENVRDLVASLGNRVNMTECTTTGFGKLCKHHRISFRPMWDNPFMLPRKHDVAEQWPPSKWGYRKIKLVEGVPTVPTQCISVDSSDQTYLCTKNYIRTHNTGKSRYHDPRQLMLFALWVLYKFPKVKGVETRYAWVEENCSITKEVYMRHHIDDLWAMLMPDLKQYVQAFREESWQARESWKCGFCPVTTCQHWREPRK
jgi:hypothetical protein